MLPRQFYSLRQKINERMPHGPAVSTVYMLHEVYADGEAPADAVCAVSLSRFTAWLDKLPADQVGTPEQRRCGKSLRFSLRLRGITIIYAVPMHGTRTQWSSPCLYVSWPPHVSMCSRTAVGPPFGTEPKIKFYYSVRAAGESHAHQRLAEITARIHAALGLALGRV